VRGRKVTLCSRMAQLKGQVFTPNAALTVLYLSWPKTPIRSKIRPQASIAVLAEKYHPLRDLSAS